MKILAVDVGTGTQDILLYDPRLDVENSFKLVVPAPTMIVHRKIKAATQRGVPLALTGVTMGGGPSQWAVNDHLDAGYKVYAAPEAAKSFNDDLEEIAEMGITLVSEDEVAGLGAEVERIELRDFDFSAIASALGQFGVGLDDLAAVAVAVFDHGNAPPKYSDRQFRFDYLEERLAASDKLSTFAFHAADVPEIMTRMAAVVASAGDVDAPLVLMDTAPAAVLGVTFDPVVRSADRLLVANVGNFHTLAFRLGPVGIEGVFEHHTGLVDLDKLDGLLAALADGSLTHEQVFGDHGHGALILHGDPLPLDVGPFGVAVTGPRQSMMLGSRLRPHFATPFGDMMLAGCFGLLSAVGDLMPELSEPIRESLRAGVGRGTPPWEVG
ncbi:DUF1786 domain-containing protein [Chloroflexota bacterium]